MPKNISVDAPVLCYMLNSKREPVPALFAPGQYIAARAHEEQAHHVVNVERGLTLAEAVAENPPPPVPKAFA